MDFDLAAEIPALSHKRALEITNNILDTLLRDPLLSEVDKDVTSNDLQLKIDLELGKSFYVYLRRETENGPENIPLISNHKITVAELKKTIQRTLTKKVIEEGGPSCLSWKYFWKTYWLVHRKQKLTDNSKTMKYYDISDGSELTLIKRLRRK